MAVRIEKAAGFHLPPRLVLVGYGLDKYGVIDLSGWFERDRGAGRWQDRVDTSSPSPGGGPRIQRGARSRDIWVWLRRGPGGQCGLDTAPAPSTTRRV